MANRKKVRNTTKITVHAKERIKERASGSLIYGGQSFKNSKQMSDYAKKNGVLVSDYIKKDKMSAFRSYLVKKANTGKSIYLYLKHIFIFSNSKLITFYPVPEEYIETYDKYIRERSNTNYLVYLKDRNTKKLKPFIHFKDEQKANECVLEILKPMYENSFKKKPYDTNVILRFLKRKKAYKIEVVVAVNENQYLKEKEIYEHILLKRNIS